MSNTKTIVVQQITLKLIQPNPANRLITQDAIDTMADSLDTVGLLNPIKVIPLRDGTYEVFSGHIRQLAALKLGWESIDCVVTNKTRKEAIVEGIWDNRQNAQTWLDDCRDIENLTNEDSDLTIPQLAKILRTSESDISRGKRLLKCLNPASRALIDQNLKKTLISSLSQWQGQQARADQTLPKSSNSWEPTLKPVYALTQLEDPDLVFRALKALIDHQLTEPQAKAMVEAIQAGTPPEAFNPSAKPQTAPKALASKPSASSSPIREDSAKTAGPIPSESQLTTGHSPKTEEEKPADDLSPTGEAASDTELFAWQWLAGISFISQIRSKLKKKEKLTGGEKTLVVIWRGTESLGGLVKDLLKVVHIAWKFIWKLLKEADRLVERLFGKTVSNLIHLALAIALIWGLWYGYHHNPLRQLNAMVSKVLASVWSGSSTQTDSSPKVEVPPTQPAANASTSNSELLTPNSMHQKAHAKIKPQSQPVLAAQTEDVNSIQDELAGLPNNIVIKPFAYAPGAMNDDMSLSRMSDLQDGEKYTVRLGGDKEKVMSVTPSFSKCVITLQSSLAGLGLLNNTSRLEIYWEDVLQLHCNVIESISPNSGISSPTGTQHAKLIYQLSLLATGLKKPLTVQCSTAENLERLVSALEFKLKTSRGSAAPITAIPYLHQGLRLNRDGFVATLWADSPLEKAGVKLGEIPWSVEKDTVKQQKVADLENELQSLAPGEHTLYKVTANQWAAALKNAVADDPNTFRPFRRTVKFMVF